MAPLSLLSSVIALATAGITITVIVANKAKQQKAVREALSKNQERATELHEHLQFSREHMPSVEA